MEYQLQQDANPFKSSTYFNTNIISDDIEWGITFKMESVHENE